MDLGSVFTPEQIPGQGAVWVDEAALCQALPSLDLGLNPPRPPGLTVGEGRGVP